MKFSQINTEEGTLIKDMAMLEALNAVCSNQVALVLEQGADINSGLDKCGNTALHMASRLFDSLSCVRMLVERGANVNAENVEGCSPLHLASSYGNVDVVRYLLTNNALVNQQDKTGATPLHKAAQCGAADNGRIIEMLLDSGAEFKEDEFGRTAMHYMWLNKTESLIDLLLERGLGDQVCDCHDNTLLHLAVKKVEDTRFFKSLLENGVSINRKNKFGQTALHIAARRSNCLDNIKLLLERGVDVNVEDCSGETALVYAIKHENYATIVQLINKGAKVDCKDYDGNTGLHISAIKSNNILFKIMLSAGVSVNEVNNNGNTALHLAVIYSNTTCMLEGLLHTEIDVVLENNKGMTAYHLALFLNKLEYAYLLLQKTSEIDVCDGHGDMLIHKAVKNKSTDLLQKLITTSENLHHKNHQKMTALHLAAMLSYKIGIHMFLANEIKGMSTESSGRALFKSILRSDKTTLRKLLKGNNDLNYKDSSGRTALHWAALRGFSIGVDLLIKKGLNVNEEDLFGNTPLHFAVLINKRDIVRKLLINGADLNHQDEDLRTALHFAAIIPDNYDTDSMVVLNIDDSDPSDPMFGKLRAINAEGLLDLRDCDGNTPLHLALMNNNYLAVDSLLIWGASTDSINNSGESLLCSFSKCDFLVKGIFVKQIVRLKEAKLETYNFGLNNSHECDTILLENCVWKEIIYTGAGDSCEKELNEMLNLKVGRFHLYDVFKLRNLSFILDDDLKSALFSIFIQEKFRNYCQMLQAKFLKSEVRYRRINKCLRIPLFATISNTNEVHLPVEIKLMIFSLLSDEDLVNVIRA